MIPLERRRRRIVVEAVNIKGETVRSDHSIQMELAKEEKILPNSFLRFGNERGWKSE